MTSLYWIRARTSVWYVKITYRYKHLVFHCHVSFMEYNHWPVCIIDIIPDSKVHGANKGPIWGRQDTGGPHVGPRNFAIWDTLIIPECVRGPVTVSNKTSYRTISWSLASTRLVVQIILSLAFKFDRHVGSSYYTLTISVKSPLTTWI